MYATTTASYFFQNNIVTIRQIVYEAYFMHTTNTFFQKQK